MSNNVESHACGFLNSDYQLIDFGGGRKLERFGDLVLDRPSPAAQDVVPQRPNAWSSADVHWPDRITESANVPWYVTYRSTTSHELRFKLKLTPFGHVGLFPEQAEHWRWLYHQAIQKRPRKLPALNLFAYTGGTTLVLASAGMEVVHIDSSIPAVAWARENAALSKLDDKPIRWIVEDALKFVQRELRRGNSYDLIALDPPSYGHDPGGQSWSLENDWRELLDGCLRLLSQSTHGDLLWTGHSPSPTIDQLRQHIEQFSTETSQAATTIQSGRNKLIASTGKTLDSGYYLRLSRSRGVI